jgi:hypothetical protein
MPALTRLGTVQTVVSNLVAPASGANKKAPVRLEDEGIEPCRGATTICPGAGPCGFALPSLGQRQFPCALTGAPETSYFRRGAASGFTGWLRGVVQEGQRRYSQPGHRSLHAAKSPNPSPSGPFHLILRLYHTSHQSARVLQALLRVDASCRERLFSPMIVRKPGQRQNHPDRRHMI